MYHYLETLCDYLYDSLRPRILHETKLETLCELCNVIQALNSLDGDNDDDAESEDADASGDVQYATRRDESSFNLSVATATATELAESNMRFSELLGTVLQDVQTRLVFRAQYIVEAEVLNYAPKPEELDYPALLVESRGKGKGKETPTLAQWQKENGGVLAMGVVEEDGIAVFKLPPQEVMENWYPTLKKTLWVLSRLHSYVNVGWVLPRSMPFLAAESFSVECHFPRLCWRSCQSVSTVSEYSLGEDRCQAWCLQAGWTALCHPPSPHSQGNGPQYGSGTDRACDGFFQHDRLDPLSLIYVQC